MYRWPVELSALSLGSHGATHEAILEITPRAAAFTLAALSHVGHPAHLALIDAYVKGQVRLTSTATIGEDSRQVAASLAVPLLVAFELRVERLSLADLCLLPREERPARRADRSAGGQPTFTPDSPRLLLRAADTWHGIRGAERFEAPGCLGSRVVGQGDPWVHAVAALPDGDEIGQSARSGRWPVPILAEVRRPSSDGGALPPDYIANQRAQALARWAGLPRRTSYGTGLVPPYARAARPGDPRSHPANGLASLMAALAEPLAARRPVQTLLLWHDLEIDISLTPELDGYQTLYLLPPADAAPSHLVETMRDLAWETIENLIGRPLPERRTEPIVLRLVGEDGRTVALDVGASVVIGRNQTVFAAWVGSDGRVMLKLLPPGGMASR